MEKIKSKVKNKIKYFWKKAFIRDVATLQFGSLVSTGFTIVASVIFARILGINNYGVYSLIFAFTGLIGMFLDIGMSYAGIVLIAEAYAKKDYQEIKNILTYFIRVTLLVNLFIGGTALVFAPFLTEKLYHNAQIGVYARLVLGAIIIRVMFSMLILVLHSTRKITILTITENLNTFFYKLLPIVFVFMGMGVFGIVFGHFITASLFLVASIVYYQHLTTKDALLPSLKEIFFNKNKIAMWRYFNFGAQIAIDRNLGNLFTMLPLTFLGMYVAPAGIGYFTLGLSYISIPMLLNSTVSRMLSVQLPKSKVISKKLLKEHFIKTTMYSLAVVIVIIIPFVIAAPLLVKIFYGAEYAPAAKIGQYLSLYVVMSGLGVGISPIYRTLHKMEAIIKINAFVIAFGAPFVFLSIKFYGMLGMVVAYTIWVRTSSIISYFYALKLINREVKKEELSLQVCMK